MISDDGMKKICKVLSRANEMALIQLGNYEVSVVSEGENFYIECIKVKE